MMLDAATAAAEPIGEVLLSAPGAFRRGVVEVDGSKAGALPSAERLRLAPGAHRIALLQGAARLTAEVVVRAGVRATLRWPRPSSAEVRYQPTVGVILEPGSAAAELQQAVISTLHRAQLTALGEHGTPLPVAQPDACAQSPACLQEHAEAHGLRHVLAVQTSPSAAGIALQVRLFDAETGDVAAEQAADCAACAPAQAASRLSVLCESVLKDGRKRPLGLLEVTSQPPGAEVLIDGHRLGRTPLRRQAGPGEHQIVLHKTGYLDYQNTVEVLPSRGSALDAVLTPEAAPAAAPDAARPPLAERRSPGS
jgi:hypothetical protein